MNNRYIVLGIALISVLSILAAAGSTTTFTTSSTSVTTSVTTVPTTTVATTTTVPVSNNYTFNASIGSVLNRGIINNALSHTKTLQATGKYTFNSITPYTIMAETGQSSPYTDIGFVPESTTPVASFNGGGVSFSTFTNSHNDNILRIDRTQLKSLLLNRGPYAETEYLFLTGFPVYDQASAVQNFALLSAGGVYQITFANTIPSSTSNPKIEIFNQTWTISSFSHPSTVAPNTEAVAGGNISITRPLTSITKLNVNSILSNGPFSVQLRATSNAIIFGNSVELASFNVYYNGVLTNVTNIQTGKTGTIDESGTVYNIYVNQTFVGTRASKDWAKIQLLSNVTLTSGRFDPENYGWDVSLLWKGSSPTVSTALYSIILYNFTPTTLLPGQSFAFTGLGAKAPSVAFVGQTLGSASDYDNVNVSTSTFSSLTYQNVGTQGSGIGMSINNITEPAQILTATSQISNSFSYAGQTDSYVRYDLTSYALDISANALANAGATPSGVTYVATQYTNVNAGTWITSTNPLVVTITGYTSRTSTSPITQSITVTGPLTNMSLGTTLYNVTGIRMNRALPGSLKISALSYSHNTPAQMALLTNTAPGVVYQLGGKAWESFSQSAAGNVMYNQQTGQPTATFILNPTTPSGTGIGQYFTYSISEIAVPTSTTATDKIKFGIDNSTVGVGASPLFQLNQTATTGAAGVQNNLTYVSTQGISINAGRGFITERGSKIATITPSILTLSLAKSVDTLQFKVG